jgi:endonuclease/exonuclease/phosphatase family metal-dependent hydrolase
MRLRVATFNAQSFRFGVDVAADVLAPVKLDMLLVQECGPRRSLARLARILGLEMVSSHRTYHRVRNGVLFGPSWRVSGVDVHDLARDAHTMPRGFIAAHLRSAGGRVTAVSAHLGLSGREREVHARELTDALAGVDWPLVLGVDLNEGPEGPAARWIASRLFDAFGEVGEGPGESFPADAPTARIDFVFVGGGGRAMSAWVPSSPASDHRAVVADVEIDEA